VAKQPRIDFLEILRILRQHKVDCIVVGGVSGVLHGAPITTIDLDVVHSRTAENIERLLAALDQLDAFARGQGERRLRPGRTHLESAGHQLLLTKHGPLDLLGTVAGGRGFEDLVEHTVEMHVGSLKVRVIDLDTLIELKERAGRDKDTAVLAILKRTRDEGRKSGKR
jgi:predicted nucleotidyltransferase